MKPNEALIDRLVRERTIRKPFRLSLGLVLLAIATSVGAATAIAWAARPGAPFSDTLRGSYEVAVLLGFLSLALLFAIGTAIPGWIERRPMLTRATLIASASATATIFIKAGKEAAIGPFFGTWGVSCGIMLAAVGAGSGLFLRAVLRRGTVTRPALSAWGVTLFGCSMGLLVLEVHCRDESASHLLVGHLGGLLAFVLFFAPFAFRQLANRK